MIAYSFIRTLPLLPAVLAFAGLQAAVAGEVSGIPTPLPPTVQPDYRFSLGNDFLAPGTNDDFRTQQINAAARIHDRWFALLDHSMMTRKDAVDFPPSRIDTMTLSLGYEFFRSASSRSRTTAAAGVGVRGIGNFEGERIQNGFHQLIESGTSDTPYTDTRRTDPAVWLFAEDYRRLRPASGQGLFGGWDLGLWTRAGVFATTNGQLDAVAGVFALVSRSGWDLWMGLRRDWRSGYDFDPVLNDTAAEENKGAFVYGARFGALVIETVARRNSSASYGQVSFISAPETRRDFDGRPARADLQLALHIPHMTFQAAGRWNRPLFLSPGSRWQESVLVEVRAGRPQLGRDATRFVATYQATVGLEYSRPLTEIVDWLGFYGNGSIGWRSERLYGREELLGVGADAVGRAVVVAESGLEVDAARLFDDWRLRLRLGVTAWLPSSDATASIGGEPSTIQEPGASIVVGWVLAWL